MSQQTTFSSYGAAVASGADDGWQADRSTTEMYPADLALAARPASPGDDREPTKYVTFGCVEYTPQE
ncbi:hypothetical protein [Halobaculum limi]|uniref:hypothetical protein n=1 Tax=Halobaculum limi TaxID=3031916 RepID=UPI00240707B0|nr:hypothetical protein [Halobaculum sp. YSMS11]